MKIRRCHREMPSGEVCGKPLGRCIHWYVPTKFGARPQADVTTETAYQKLKAELFGERE